MLLLYIFPTTSQLIGSPKNCFVPESRLHASRIVVVAFRNYDDYGGDEGFYITIKKMRRRERRSDEVNEDEDICADVHLVEQLERPIVD